MTTSRRHRPPESPTTHRLFAAQGPSLAEHQQRFGALPESAGTTLVTVLDQSGLTGRGGAGFPTGRKIASVTGRKAVVIANGAEGEPLSHKDAELLSRAPHLVLDGLKVAAAAVSADKVVMYVPFRAVPAIKTALSERRSAKVDRHRVTVVAASDGFVAGEESAVVRRVEGGQALPRDRTVLDLDIRGAGAPHTGQQRRNAGPYRSDCPVRICLVPVARRSVRAGHHAGHPDGWTRRRARFWKCRRERD